MTGADLLRILHEDATEEGLKPGPPSYAGSEWVESYFIVTTPEGVRYEVGVRRVAQG